MKYIALLRGINVGGKANMEMTRLKQTFGNIGFTDISTYINSGNVLFTASNPNIQDIEKAIEKDFGFYVPIVLRTYEEIERLVHAIPNNWVNDQKMKCDVMFLWKEIDKRSVLKSIPINPDIEQIMYVPGAVIWRIDRVNVTRGKMAKIVGTDVYKKMTIRNPNTVRKLYELMKTA